METTVVAVREIGPDGVALTLTAPAGFDAAPGQFVRLAATPEGATEPISRFYTVSSPRVEDHFEVTLTVDPTGDLAPYLAARRAGDQLTMAGPFGDASYDGETAVLALAGGPGIGAALAVAERAIEDGGRAAIVYRDERPLHEDRLATLRERGGHVAIVHAPAGETDVDTLADAVETALDALADDPDPESGNETRRADRSRDRADDPGPQAFVYGFADFVDTAGAALETVAPTIGAAAKRESFGPTPSDDTGDDDN